MNKTIKKFLNSLTQPENLSYTPKKHYFLRKLIAKTYLTNGKEYWIVNGIFADRTIHKICQKIRYETQQDYILTYLYHDTLEKIHTIPEIIDFIVDNGIPENLPALQKLSQISNHPFDESKYINNTRQELIRRMITKAEAGDSVKIPDWLESHDPYNYQKLTILNTLNKGDNR